MSAENQGFVFSKWQQVNATASATAVARQISTSRAVLSKVIVNSHTSAAFRFANGTTTNYTPIGGSYTPAAGSSVIEFGEVDAFSGGLVMLVAGTFDGNVIYNDLP
jgi:hypothetical protein